MKSRFTADTKDLYNIAEDLIKTSTLRPLLVALTGDLGAGKTTFIQTLCKSLAITENVISPTFIIHREYNVPGAKYKIQHLDLYRLESIEELKEIDIPALLTNRDIVLIEWADKFEDYIHSLVPANNLVWMTFEHLDETHRLITIETQ